MFDLRPQQIVLEDAVRKAFARHRCVLAVAPTGFGKAVCLADMAFKATQRGKRVLVVTNRRVVVLQLTEQCQRAGIETGIVMGSIERTEEAPVQVASIQTLERRGFSDIKTPDFLMVDECHNYHDSYKRLIRERFSGIPVLGMTATPVGPNGAKIRHFDVIVEPVKNSEVIAAGHLLPVKYIAPSEPDMGGIDLKRASKGEIGDRVDAVTIYGDVFLEWQPYSSMQTMVVLPSRAVCNGFLNECLRRGYSAKVVDGTTAQDERDETFSEFKAEDCQFLLGVDVIREGLDLPIAQCLIDLHPTHQFRVWWQTLGRIKRPHDGQEYAVTLDFAGNLWRHMVHPDQDPPWEDVTSDTTIEAAVEKKSGIRCPECGSKDVFSVKDFGYKCEDCGATWQPKRNWVCPHCKAVLGPNQKLIGGVCPNCHEKVTSKPVRRIRMEDGSMRTVPAHEIKRRKKSKADSEQAAWTKFVFIANGWNKKNPGKPQKKLAWCREMFHKETGHYPREGLKYMPSSVQSGDWRRTPDDVFQWLGKRNKKPVLTPDNK